MFLADAPPHMQRIKEGLAQGDSEAVRHSAHTTQRHGQHFFRRTRHASGRAGREDSRSGRLYRGGGRIWKIALTELLSAVRPINGDLSDSSTRQIAAQIPLYSRHRFDARFR